MEDDEYKIDGCEEDQLDEETLTLLKLAEVHITAKRIFAAESEVKKRSKEKDIPFYKSRKELIDESKGERGRLVAEAKKLLKPKLSKETKQKLRILEAGRPKGSKNKTAKISQSDFFKKLRQLARAKNQAGEALTQQEAAIALGVGGERQLRKRLRDYGENRNWKEFVESLLV